MTKNNEFHNKPFDEGTITKLEIFENYAKEWLPPFIMSGYYKEMWIFDFFAGTGYDTNGVAGSPIRILQQIKNQIGNIFQNKTKINVCFNELNKEKFDILQQLCKQFVADNPELEKAKVNIVYRNEDFVEIFPKELEIIQKYPSLVYLDQYGIKYTEDFLTKLEKVNTVDFLLFISSSYIWRLGNKKEFQDNLRIDMEKAKQNPYKYIHKSILEQLREKLPPTTELSLYPFTIKKKSSSNIYGIIFGAKHPLAVNKFLEVAWKQNSINGEANFDIDDDINKSEQQLFPEHILPTKIEKFQEELREKVLSNEIQNNRDAFIFTLEQGHIATHARNALNQMKREKLISFDAKEPLCNYEQVFKNKNIVEYKIITEWKQQK